jgi:hypothetical protein
MRRYIEANTVPKSVGAGRVLMHNPAEHSRNTPCGMNGFRAWTDDKPLEGFQPCRCGWSGLPHYSLNPDYECEPA